MENSLAYKIKEDKLACKIHQSSGCSWKEAFERASIELFEEENEQPDY